ncbi:beta-lactamase family protein [Dyadobacter sp. LJ53]|uniref:serine hydrolase domain-containing protein n=1 Tax=Dyadobacter chenwenxiniae TaxID=2906456 RepID=UPI001F203A7E|nr:serine hydrolase domain-containing protein [Dyadobacter chenwenxiniae]MCF0049066.1 beta-lactamase family protein [Dyadobacter chenwenxiniae]
MRLFVSLFILFHFAECLAQNTGLDSDISAEMKRLNIPGMAVAKIEAGEVAWTGHFGFQNLEKQIPVTGNTIFQIASISKTVTAAAIMQLAAKGYFSLDDDVSGFLPFSVRSSFHPRKPITFRQLLRHRSSIRDNFDYLLPFWEGKYKGPNISLDIFLQNYLAIGGSNYHKDKNFIQAAPGDRFEYSNMGYALLGYLVERIANMPFDEYCQKNLFSPLEMRQTNWFPDKMDANRIATPYIFSDSLKVYQRQQQSTFPDYPAGQLRCSIGDLARFLVCWTNDGKFEGKSIIDSVAVQTLTPKDMSLGFHTWFLYLFNTETPMYGHNGHGPGVSTYMLYDPFSKNGLVILMNGELSSYMDWRSLINLLYQKRSLSAGK